MPQWYFPQVLSSKELLDDFLKPLERLVQKQLQKTIWNT